MPHRAGEITFYEELGIAPDATPEQIHESFRSLVRLLHPDQQMDAQLKEIAERQMRKINRIYAVLSDPDRRRRYDDSLEEDHWPPTIIFSPSSDVQVGRLMSRLAWVGASLVGVVVLIWLAADGTGAETARSRDRVSAAQRVAPTGTSASDLIAEIERLRADLGLAQAQRDAAIRQLHRSRGLETKTSGPEELARDEPPPAGPALPLSTAVTELPAPLKPSPAVAPPRPVRDAPAAARPAAAPARSFAGFWFYTRAAQGAHNNTALYPPEFIEATINEQGGVVTGKYRARYEIVDRAIPPDVNFEFSGTSTGPVMVCQWTGPGGAKGQITLKMTTDNVMQVDWNTSSLGTVQGLVAGTAKLTRRID
ncbi:MAG: J domain-containing protein [Bryobacteraceae bacterium]|jgi:curved DNA-binding protein CbpA